MRLGALQISQGCVMYEDPNNPGSFIADAGTSALCMPSDPGAAQAVVDWAAGTTSAANLTALNAGQGSGSASAASGTDTMNQTASPGVLALLPSVPLGFTLSSSTQLWLLIAAGLVIFAIAEHRR